MKIVGTFILLMILPTISFGQYSRSFYTSESFIQRHGDVFGDNGQLFFVSIKESSLDTLRIVIGEIDETGITSNYHYIEAGYGFDTGAMSLTGATLDSSGDVVLAIASKLGSSAIVSFVEVDLVTDQVLNLSTVTGSYKSGFVRSKVNGDSLITYIGRDAGGMDRISVEIDAILNYSIEEADPAYSYTGNFLSTRKFVELMVNGTDEYFTVNDVLVKRDINGTYSNTMINGLIIYPSSITINDNSEIVIFKGLDYTVFDQSLTELSTGVLAITVDIGGNYEAYSHTSGYKVWTKAGITNVFYELDNNFNAGPAIDYRGKRTFGTYTNLNGTYIIGDFLESHVSVDIQGVSAMNQLYSMSIIKDNYIDPVAKFKEFQQILTHEKIRFIPNHLGKSFSDPNISQHGFHLLKGGLKRPLMYAAATNFFGVTGSNELKGYYNEFSSELLPGPFTTLSDYNHEIMDKYNRGYYVTVDMIEDHITNTVNGTLGYVIPFGIKEWPVEGDVLVGQGAVLAAYVDRNDNGTYDPENGDYPKIYGDHCLLNIYHQPSGSATSSEVECHQYYFTFDCDTSDVTKNTVFMRQKYIARGMDFDSVYMTQFADFNIGNSSDDYMGTNVELGMIYGFNADPFDESSGGNIGFQDTIPAMGVMYVQGVKLFDDGSDNNEGVLNGESINGIGFNDAVIDNEYYTMEASLIAASTSSFGDYPQDISGNYFMSKGLTPLGLPKQVNGVDVRYDYFGNSDPLFYGSNGVDHGNNDFEVLIPSPGGDRRGYMTSGPGSSTVNDTLEIITAYMYGIDTVNIGIQSSIDKLFTQGATLRNNFSQGSLGCNKSFGSYLSDNLADLKEINKNPIQLYPNPAKGTIQIDGLEGTSEIAIYDLSGVLVVQSKSSNGSATIDLSNLSNAVYILMIEDDLGLRTARVIKQ